MWSFKRVMPYTEQEKTLLASGRRGQAEIVTARPTGTVWDVHVSPDEWGTFKVALRVTPDGAEAPFDVTLRMRLPPNVSGERSTVFPVLFDPENHEFLIVDPGIVPRTREESVAARIYAPELDASGSPVSAETLGALAAQRLADPLAGAGLRQKLMAAAVGVSATAPPDLAEKLSYARTGNRLLTSGVEAPAVVNTITPGGEVGASGALEVSVIDVTITPAEGDPYPATIKQVLNPAALGLLSPGAAISVRYDPQDPTSALIYRFPS
jgi:hypothetical protein